MIKLGTQDIKRVFLGSSFVKRTYIGTEKVYDIYNDPVSALFFRRQTAGGSVTSPALPQYGKAALSTIKGNSMVWNQLVDTSSLQASGSYNGISFTYADGVITAVSGTATGTTFSSAVLGTINVSLVKGHQYFLGYGGGTEGKRIQVFSANAGNKEYSNNTADAVFFTCEYDATDWEIRVRIAGGTTVNNDKFTFNLVDLTLLFNNSIPTGYTVADFERDYPLKYYGYNPGEIIDLTGQGLETVGFNQWDEQWESGILDDTTGEPIPFSNRWRTKNFIPCLPGTAYYFHNGGSGALYVFEYDSAQNCIKYTTVSNAALTTQAGTHFLKFYVAGYGATYNHDICINISNATKNGTYEPYWKETKNLGLDSFDVLDGQGNTITIHGLAKAGSAYDEIDLARQKYVKRRKRVNLGDLSWSATSYTNVFAAVLTGAKSAEFVPANQINSKGYISVFRQSATSEDKSITVNSNAHTPDRVLIKDSAYSDATTFQAAMDGVYLDFEIATPEEYDLETPMDAEYRMDYLGTEALTPENSSSPSTAKFSADIKYPK